MRPIGCVLALLLSPAALAGKPPVFVVKVVDAAGAPIPHGVVVFPAEGERHVVHGTSGTWTGTGLVTAAGEAPFAQGQ